MKTIPLAEIFQLLIHLQKLFMTDFYSLECHEVYINTTLVLLLLLVRSLYKTWALFILICKNDQFCFISFPKKNPGKKAHIFNYGWQCYKATWFFSYPVWFFSQNVYGYFSKTFTNCSEKMTCLQLCVLFNFQICGTFLPMFVDIF